MISTVKHFTLNANETNRHSLDALIDDGAHHESDLLAFAIAIERGAPGSVMTAYNKVNGVYAGTHAPLIEGVLKGEWGYPGWVMSDWGATPRWEYALAGLDQESGIQIDELSGSEAPFTGPLRAALRARRAAARAPVGHGAADPAIGVRGRPGCVGVAPPRCDLDQRTPTSRSSRPARGSCCCATTACCRSPPRRRTPPPRCASR